MPSYRSDLNHAFDLPEEVLRLCGYDRIKEEKIRIIKEKIVITTSIDKYSYH